MSIHESLVALHGALGARERKYQFQYGEHHDVAVLSVFAPNQWDSSLSVRASFTMKPGTWNSIGHLPDSTVSKQALAAAKKETGLSMLFVGKWEKGSNGEAYRTVEISKASYQHLHSLLPTFVNA